MRSTFLKLAPPALKAKTFTLSSDSLVADIVLTVHPLTAVDSLAVPGYADELLDEWKLKPPTITADDGTIEVLHASETTCRTLTTLKVCLVNSDLSELDMLQMLRYPDLADQLSDIYLHITSEQETEDDDPKNSSTQPIPSSQSDPVAT